MTKYLLHGGTKKVGGIYLRDEKFMEDMLSTEHHRPINMLLCYFAKDKARWPALLEADQKDFMHIAKGREIIFHVADEVKFTEQIQGCDVIYLRGGDGHLMKSEFAPSLDWNELLGGKVVAGCSAGANLLAKYYYDNDYDNIEEGLGILPIKTICHYGPQLSTQAHRLDDYGESLPLYKLEEDMYIELSC